jgi:hypothetical protein
MAEHRITESEVPAQQAPGQVHHTTIITEEPRRSGGGGTIMMVIVVLLVAAVAFWAVTQVGGAEVAKDNAVAEAAADVGNAASQVGDAAQDAAGTVTGN